MLLKRMKKEFTGKVKTWEGKRVFYTQPIQLYNDVSPEDWEKIKNWNGICIYSSPEGKPNKCFYFYWGYGGNPEYVIDIDLHYLDKNWIPLF